MGCLSAKISRRREGADEEQLNSAVHKMLSVCTARPAQDSFQICKVRNLYILDETVEARNLAKICRRRLVCIRQRHSREA